MKKICILFLAVIFGNILAASHQVYSYRETVKDSSAITYYEVVETDTLIKRIYKIGKEQQISYYNKNYQTTKFVYQDKDSNYTVVPQHGKLVASGIRDGEKLYEEFKLEEDSPWWQSMSYSLSRFVNSEAQEVSYQVFVIGKLDVMQMQAEKEEIETIAIEGTNYNASKVKISISGFWGNFWSAYYWFRESDGLFLKYEGANGPPGTPTTLIEFIEKIK